MSNTIQIEIETNSVEQSEILIAELSEINFDAFEENENSLSTFINEENFNEDEFKKILLRKNIFYTKTIIAETNWNAKWESEFEPIVIVNFVAIRAYFHAPVNTVAHEIIITPKMSFGTGHHATTYLMVQQMEHINFLGKSVLDFGTGTGILAILAKKLGAKKVVAIDNDEWSINNAKENFSANNCNDIILLQKDNLSGLEQFDIILANINLNVIAGCISQIKIATHSNSKLLLSGFLKPDEKKIADIFKTCGFKHIFTKEKNDWIAILLIKY